MNILVLEASTTSAKVMLYHTESGTEQILTQEYSGTNNHSSAQNPEQVYQELMQTGRTLAAGTSVDLIALSATWHNIMLCDSEVHPLTAAYNWADTSASSLCTPLRQDTGFTKNYYQHTGCMVNAIYPYFKLMWLREQGFSLKGNLAVSQGDYLLYRMTGQRVTTRCLVSGSGLLNIHSRSYDSELLALAQIPEGSLFPLIDSDHAYPLGTDAASLLGLPAGIPVLPPNSDGGLNQVGVGALRNGVATFSVGTSGAIRITTPKPVLPESAGTWCYLSPRGYLSGAATNGCCNCIDWAKGRLFPAGTSYDTIESGVSDPIETPVFLPFLFGERCPGWKDGRRGGWRNVKGSHNASDLYLAVQEGVLFNLYQCYELLTAVNEPPSEIRLSGGILKSKRWKQMCADIFGVPLLEDGVEQGSLMGGAVLGLEQLGLLPDVSAYHPTATHVIQPNPAQAELYHTKYQNYLACYNESIPLRECR